MAWVSAQNFRVEDFQAFWKLVGAGPGLFLELAREIWLHPERGVHADESLIKALANAAERPVTAEHLRRHAAGWLSGYWPDPDMGRFLGYDPDTAEAEERRKATTARRGEWDEAASSCGPEVPIHCVHEGDASWFAHRAVGVLSFLPRAPFVPALVGWALSRAIMGFPRHFEEVAWLLRWNHHDPDETDVAVRAALPTG